MKKIKLALTAIYIILSFDVWAQSTIWRFGNQGGLKFNSNGTTSPNSGSIANNSSAATSITDQAGNLMFYVSGKQILDRSNNILVSALHPYNGGTDPAVIVPIPGKCNTYVIFVRPGIPTSVPSLYICLVSVTGNAPNYTTSVSTVEELQFSSGVGFSERIAAVKDNSVNIPAYWLAVRDLSRNGVVNKGVYSFHFTSSNMASVNTTSDVIDAIEATTVESILSGTISDMNAPEGQMKFSKSGLKAATLTSDYGRLEIMNFNHSTGVFTMYKSIMLPVGTVVPTNLIFHSLEFSPDENFIYVAERSGSTAAKRLIQIDYKSSSPTFTVITSITPNSSTENIFNGLQLGPDDKIYISGPREGNANLSVISNPNGAGSACQYSQNSVSISGTNKLTLPPIISGFSYPGPLTISPSSVSMCVPKNTTLTASGGLNYNWNPTGATTNSIVVIPNTSTTYTVTGALYNGCLASTTTTVNVGVTGSPIIVTNNPYLLCPGNETVTLSLNGATGYYADAAFQWQLGDCNGSFINIGTAVAPTHTITHPFGQYRVRVGCGGNYGYSNDIGHYYVSNCSFAPPDCGGPGGCGDCRLVNQDGTDVLSDINEKLNVYPNPTSGECILMHTSAVAQEATILILNILGEEIYKTNYFFSKGENQLQLDLGNHPKGVYYVKIVGANKQLGFKLSHQ